MTQEFNRIITLLRKEKGITQKQAATALGISQALLSHYEKGIRECGLGFIIKVSEFYDVSCDYLLGKSADRTGLTLKVEDIPAGEMMKDSIYKGSLLPTLNKKLLVNSLNILFDKVTSCQNKAITVEVSNYMMLSVYRMFRLLYSAQPKNSSSMFSIPAELYSGYTAAEMCRSEAIASALLLGQSVKGDEPITSTESLEMTTESIARDYPLYATSLLNLIKSSEGRITTKEDIVSTKTNDGSAKR